MKTKKNTKNKTMCSKYVQKKCKAMKQPSPEIWNLVSHSLMKERRKYNPFKGLLTRYFIVMLTEWRETVPNVKQAWEEENN